MLVPMLIRIDGRDLIIPIENMVSNCFPLVSLLILDQATLAAWYG